MTAVPSRNCGRAHRQAGQQHERGRDLVPAGEMMLDQEARMQAQRLRLDVEVEIIAKPLAGLRPSSRPSACAEQSRPKRIVVSPSGERMEIVPIHPRERGSVARR
jgi:hypothetical protein